MDKVLVLGALEELGFEMTTILLEEGYEVCGIHLSLGEELIYNERRLEIGRNANFIELSLAEWMKQEDANETPTWLFMNDFDENIRRILLVENSELKRKIQSAASMPKNWVVFIHPFSQWENRNVLESEGSVKDFFVPLPKKEQAARFVKGKEREEFQSIFKAILDLVC
jgi:hypothetical protein